MDSLAPCPNSEDGFASACSSVVLVQPVFIAMATLLGVGFLLVGLAVSGLLDAICPDPRAGLAALRAVDPGFDEEDWSSAAGAAPKQEGGTPAAASRCGRLCPAMAQAGSAPTLDQEDAKWSPAVTDNNLVAALRAIRQHDWANARSLAKRFLGGAAFGPAGVAPDAPLSAAMTPDEAALVVRAALRSARASMLLVPFITAAIVGINVAVFVEFCLEQNGLGAAFILIGLSAWVANNFVAACSRHTSLVRPLWQRGEGAPASWLVPAEALLCCFTGAGNDSDACVPQLSATCCTVSFCWPCCRRTRACRVLCGDGGPVACTRDTFGLGCCCARSLVQAHAVDAAAAGRGSAAAKGPGSASSSTDEPDKSATTLAAHRAGTWVGGSAVRTRRREWARATVTSTGTCGCLGSELVRGLMRRNGDAGAEAWQRHHSIAHATADVLSLVLGPVWIQVHMSRALPWGCCSQTWSIDAEYSEAGADVLRRQSLIGATFLGLSSVLHATVTLVDASAVSVNAVPARWTSHVNVGATLVWLLFLIISALFSRFAAVDDNDFERLGDDTDDTYGFQERAGGGDSSGDIRKRALLEQTSSGPAHTEVHSREEATSGEVGTGSDSKNDTATSVRAATDSAEAGGSLGGIGGQPERGRAADSDSMVAAPDGGGGWVHGGASAGAAAGTGHGRPGRFGAADGPGVVIANGGTGVRSLGPDEAGTDCDRRAGEGDRDPEADSAAAVAAVCGSLAEQPPLAPGVARGRAGRYDPVSAVVASARSTGEPLDTRRAGEPIVTVEGQFPLSGAGTSVAQSAEVGQRVPSRAPRGWQPRQAALRAESTSAAASDPREVSSSGQSQAQPRAQGDGAMVEDGGELRRAPGAATGARQARAGRGGGAVASVIIPAGAFTERRDPVSGTFLPPATGGGAAPRDGPDDLLSIEQGGYARPPRE